MVGRMALREFVVLHLTASISTAGLQGQTDTWGTMPSHDGQRTSRMAQSLEGVAALFRDHYEGALLRRYRPAQQSSDARSQGGIDRAILSQVATLHVNPSTKGKVAGRTVDDAPWNPFMPAPEGSADRVHHREVEGTFHGEAMEEFIASYRAMQVEQW